MSSSRLEVRVTPRASSNRIAVETDLVRVYVTAAPTDGEANAAVTALLAKHLGIAPSSLHIVRGHTSRTKLFEIPLAEDELNARLKR